MSPEAAVIRLVPEDFEKAFDEGLSGYVRRRIAEYDFRYRPMGRPERDLWLQRIARTLFASEAVRAGEHRRPEWEAGWGANLARFEKAPVFDSLVPGYFGKYPVIRWMRDFIRPETPRFEYHSLAVLQDWLFDRYLREAPAVYEFGCGTGHNLFRVRRVNPEAALYGLDWAGPSQALLAQVRQSGLDPRMFGLPFDLFAPDPGLALAPGACVLTVASLEQTGRRFGPFLDYLLNQPVGLCIHIEPIAELLDPGHLLDFLSLQYFRLRNYLDGYLERLRQLERENRIRIHLARRSHIGSLFIDGYSVIVWSPAGDRGSRDAERP